MGVRYTTSLSTGLLHRRSASSGEQQVPHLAQFCMGGPPNISSCWVAACSQHHSTILALKHPLQKASITETTPAALCHQQKLSRKASRAPAVHAVGGAISLTPPSLTLTFSHKAGTCMFGPLNGYACDPSKLKTSLLALGDLRSGLRLGQLRLALLPCHDALRKELLGVPEALQVQAR